MAKLEYIDGKKTWTRQTGNKHYFTKNNNKDVAIRVVTYVSPVKYKPRETEWKNYKTQNKTYAKRPPRVYDNDFTGDIGKALRQAFKARLDLAIVQNKYFKGLYW